MANYGLSRGSRAQKNPDRIIENILDSFEI